MSGEAHGVVTDEEGLVLLAAAYAINVRATEIFHFALDVPKSEKMHLLSSELFTIQVISVFHPFSDFRILISRNCLSRPNHNSPPFDYPILIEHLE